MLTVVICPFGIMWTAPFTSRSMTIRSVIRSTTPALPADLDHVTHRELAFDQIEKAGDHVLDQALCTKGKRQAEDARAGQHRPDINECVQAEQDAEDQKHHPTHTAQ